MTKTNYIPSRYFIEVWDYAYEYSASSKIFMPLPKCELDMEKCLKKWYNKLTSTKEYFNSGTEIHAMREDEDGSYSDLSTKWGYEYMDNAPDFDIWS